MLIINSLSLVGSFETILSAFYAFGVFVVLASCWISLQLFDEVGPYVGAWLLSQKVVQAPLWFDLDEEAIEELPEGSFITMALDEEPLEDVTDMEWELEVLNFINPPVGFVESPIVECPEETTPEEDLLSEWEELSIDEVFGLLCRSLI